MTQILIELALIAFLLTQLIGPVIFNTPIFPLFRRQKKIEQEIDAEHSRLANELLEMQLETLRAERKKGKVNGDIHDEGAGTDNRGKDRNSGEAVPEDTGRVPGAAADPPVKDARRDA